MRAVTKAWLTAVSLTASVALAGCSSSSSSTAASPSTSASVSASAPASSASLSPTPAASSTGAAPAQSASAAASASASTCQPADLTLALGPNLSTAQLPTLGQGQYDQIVNLTNSGSAPCTLDGFPGVNLVGTVSGKSGYQWPLTRAATGYDAATLQPGGSAHFGIVYLPFGSGTAGESIDVATIIVTPPNDYSSRQLPWSKTLLLQDAATHPGTWIYPVQPGA